MKQTIAAIAAKVRSSYGLLPNLLLTPRYNAVIQTVKLSTWYYFNQPTHTAFHDLTNPNTTIPKNIKLLLGLGLKFCPVPRTTTRDPTLYLENFERNLLCKTYFEFDDDNSLREDFEPKFYKESKWFPADLMVPTEINQCIQNFSDSIYRVYCQK